MPPRAQKVFPSTPLAAEAAALDVTSDLQVVPALVFLAGKAPARQAARCLALQSAATKPQQQQQQQRRQHSNSGDIRLAAVAAGNQPAISGAKLSISKQHQQQQLASQPASQPSKQQQPLQLLQGQVSMLAEQLLLMLRTLLCKLWPSLAFWMSRCSVAPAATD